MLCPHSPHAVAISSRPCPPPQTSSLTWPPGRAKFWLGMSRSCVHKPSSCGKAGAPGSPTGTGVGSCPIAWHGRAERSDGTCLGLNSQCFPPMFGTNTLLRSHSLSLYHSLCVCTVINSDCSDSISLRDRCVCACACDVILEDA